MKGERSKKYLKKLNTEGIMKFGLSLLYLLFGLSLVAAFNVGSSGQCGRTSMVFLGDPPTTDEEPGIIQKYWIHAAIGAVSLAIGLLCGYLIGTGF